MSNYKLKWILTFSKWYLKVSINSEILQYIVLGVDYFIEVIGLRSAAIRVTFSILVMLITHK